MFDRVKNSLFLVSLKYIYVADGFVNYSYKYFLWSGSDSEYIEGLNALGEWFELCVWIFP
jgi:hypothetical protein